ncbi:MAG: rhodanese-like domain-containing protein [Myxococcales bacterium]|nr:rhodanese-like domain-containing protein [Myxococcales bacterium]
MSAPGTEAAAPTANWPSAWLAGTTANSAGYRDAEVAHVAALAKLLTQAGAASDAVRLIDVREPDEYIGELGHIKGAALVPLATVEASAAAWPRDAMVVLVCRSGGRSGRAAASLRAMGFAHVVNMVGGMLAYNAAGLPITR